MAHEFNSELTVILSGVSMAITSLEPGHPARPLLFELQDSARRCADKCATVLAFAARHGVRPARAPLEAVIGL
jgi:hypothetical protein